MAAGTIGSLDIINGSVRSVDLGDGAATREKLAGGSVNSVKIANGSIVNADIAAGAAIAASKINRTGLNADLLDGVNSSALVRNNAAGNQTLAGKITAPDFAYSASKGATLTVTPFGSTIVGPYTIHNSAAIIASGADNVDWYAPVNLPDGAIITGLEYTAVTSSAGQTSAELINWVDTIATVGSTNHGFNWGTDSTSTITPGQETFDSDSAYRPSSSALM